MFKSCLTVQSISNSRLNVYVGKYRYKVCGTPYCNDTNSESEITSDIDVNSLVIINEYVFVQVENNLIFYHNYIPETKSCYPIKIPTVAPFTMHGHCFPGCDL